MSRPQVQYRCRQSSRPRFATAKRLGLTPKAVIPVDLFGLPADHDAIAAVAKGAKACSCWTTRRRRSAQRYKGRKLGTFGHATATSFFPAKPLGCYGDGGAVLTDDDAMADGDCEACACTARAATNTTTCASA